MNASRFIPRLAHEYQQAAAYSKTLENWDDGRTPDLQLASLQRVWRDCVADVPYYSELAARGEAPKEIKRWADFHSIPNRHDSTYSIFRKSFSGVPGRRISSE